MRVTLFQEQKSHCGLLWISRITSDLLQASELLYQEARAKKRSIQYVVMWSEDFSIASLM